MRCRMWTLFSVSPQKFSKCETFSRNQLHLTFIFQAATSVPAVNKIDFRRISFGSKKFKSHVNRSNASEHSVVLKEESLGLVPIRSNSTAARFRHIFTAQGDPESQRGLTEFQCFSIRTSASLRSNLKTDKFSTYA